MARVPNGYDDVNNNKSSGNIYKACFISHVSCNVVIRGTDS